MRRRERFIAIVIVGMLLSALGYLLWPPEKVAAWVGRRFTQISVDIDGLPDGSPVEVFVWDGGEERTLGVTDAAGHTSGVVELFAAGSNHRTTVDLYRERIVLRSVDTGERLKIIPLESCTVRGGGVVTRPVHQVWIHVDYSHCETLDDYWH